MVNTTNEVSGVDDISKQITGEYRENEQQRSIYKCIVNEAH